MADPDLAGLKPVTDPNLIAMLEQPQSAINKDGAAPGAPAAPAYSQSALDAFDRAIGTAQRLKTHPGFGAAVGSGFDPQAWGSFKPWSGEAFAGTKARDFNSQLDALKAQVFLPMVQSMKGMGSLSNAEGEKLTAAIGALDPGMSEGEFQSSLDRIIGDLKGYRDRGAQQPGQQPAQPGQPAAVPPVPSPAGPGDIGFNAPPPSNPLNPTQQTAYDGFWKANPKASADQLRAFGQSIGVNIDNAEQIITARDKGAGVLGAAEAVSGLTPEQKAEVERRRGGTDAVGGFVNGVGDTVTMGALPKLAAGADALGQSLSGNGAIGDNYSRNLATENAYQDGVQDDHPWAFTGGQVAGGLVLPGFGARTPAELAKVGAAYGAAYGAGSQDTLGAAAVGGVTGAATGAATGWGGGKLLERLEGRAARKAAEVGADAAKESGENAATRYARAQQFGLEPGLDGVGGRGSKIVGNTLSNMPGSAGHMNAARKKLGAEVETAAGNVADSFGSPTSFSGVGEAAQRGVNKWVDRFEQVSSKAYDAIPISDKAPANLDNTRQALGELNSIFESNPQMAETFKNTRLSRYMDALGDEGEGLSWRDLKQFRSRIGEEIGDQRFSESPTKTELRRLYGALSEDMKSTASAQGPAALSRFERANTIYRGGQQRIEDALTKIVGDDGKKSPEAAAAKIQSLAQDGKGSADFRTLGAVWKSLGSDERGEVANGLIRLLGQPRNVKDRSFNPQTFVDSFTNMAPEAKNLIFGPAGKELRQSLDDFTKVVGGLAERNALQNNSHSAGQILTGLSFYGIGNIPALLGQVATSYGAARLMTNPKFVRWATGYSKMIRGAARAGENANPAGLKTQGRLLEKLAASEPGIAQEIAPLKDWLLKAANDNLNRAAASGGNEQQQADRK